jgi:hypothetical protein
MFTDDMSTYLDIHMRRLIFAIAKTSTKQVVFCVLMLPMHLINSDSAHHIFLVKNEGSAAFLSLPSTYFIQFAWPFK